MPPVDVTRPDTSPNEAFAGTSRSTLTPEEIRNIRGGYISRKLSLGETPGERKFNLIDWGGIGYGANSALSLIVADSARNGRIHPGLTWTKDNITEPVFRVVTNSGAGKDKPAVFDDLATHARNHLKSELPLADANKAIAETAGKRAKLIEGMHPRRLFKELGTPTASFFEKLPANLGHINPENFAEQSTKAMKYLSAGRNAGLFNGFLMLGTGGWLLMAPVKWLEDHKSYLVKRFDEKYERKHHVSAAEKEEIDKRHAEIEAEPRQSWASVFGARAATYPIIMAAYMGLGREKEVNWMSRAGIPGALAEGSDKWANEAVEGIRGKLENSERMQPYLKSLDAKLDQKPARYAKRYSDKVEAHELAQKAAQDAVANGVEPPKATKSIYREFEGTNGPRSSFIAHATLTESFYSAVMASMTFAASRVLGPIFGHSKQPDYIPPAPADRAPSPIRDQAPQVAATSSAAPIEASEVTAAKPLAPGNVISAANYRGSASQSFAAKDPWDSPDDRRPEPYSASFAAPLASHAERAEQSRGHSGDLARA